MARVSATASLGLKLNLAAKREWGNYDNVTPHHSLTIERTYPDELTEEELVEKGQALHAKCRKFVETKAAQDMKDAKKP